MSRISATTAAAAGSISLGGELTVNRMGFGAMRLTGKGIWGQPADRGEAVRVLRRAIELGVNFIDTADSYGPHVAEEIIAEALHPYPEGIVIATKAGLERPGPDRWTPNGRPEYLRRQLEGSLRRLRLERLDLWQLHRIDPAVPEDEQFGAMREFQREGLVRLLGLSEAAVAEIERARRTVEIASVQNRYNLTDREWESEVEHCEGEGLAFIPWFPLSAGELEEGGPLQRVAARHEATVYQVALAWLLARSPAMLVIPGTSSVGHLEENVAAAELALSDEDLSELNAAAG
ncbi:MAG: aldo/keto reductase [Gemmatimonadales bacterium]|nr:aldo/keto reductase [Gemmatimonadales bacterium]